MVAAKMPLFNFVLRSPEQITQWAKSLHWFGLTDGWYWLHLGDQEVPRSVKRSAEAPDGLSYVDYNVVRLWEDLLDILPEILEPVPPDVAALTSKADSWREELLSVLSTDSVS